MMYENFKHTHGSGGGAGPLACEPPRGGSPVVSRSVNGWIDNSPEGRLKSGTVSARSLRLTSPNVLQWEPDVRMLMDSDRWLKIHGLRKHKLDMEQILPTIGFKHADDYVKPLKKPVKARYSEGLFTQYPFKNGTVYNLVASKDKLSAIENQLKQAISLYKKRLEWLTSESRRIFGVIEEHSVCIVVDCTASTDQQFDIFRHALAQAIKEQIMYISKFNLIRCASDMDCWQDRAVSVTLDSVDGALDWLWDLEREVEHSSSCTTEAVVKALKDDSVQAVYLFTDGDASVKAPEMLRRKVSEDKPVHIISFNCNTPSTISFFKEFCKVRGRRFHAFSIMDEYRTSFPERGEIEGESDHENEKGIRSHGDGRTSPKLGVGVRPEVMAMWQELDEARNTLAEIQALQVEIKDPKNTPISTGPVPPQGDSGKSEKSELYMSSKQFLRRHGLHGKKLGFYDLLQTLVFKHCDGVIDIQRAPDYPDIDGTNAIVRPKLVNARYCDKFAHVRWKDGSIMHVHLGGQIHRDYEKRMLASLDSYRKRMEWLQQGSRELFGTIIEEQVTLLIDTSASMASRLFLVKDKLYRLFQEQLRHKMKFNIIKFDSRVQAWRDRLVDCSTHNLDNAWQWVKGLSASGSTNTMGALLLALSDPTCQAIYLLTDGRPDQPPSSILAQIHLNSPVPIHTISFNCADTDANEFMCKMASETGARYHYFSEDGYDINGPKPFESEDLRLLREEIEKGQKDLRRVALLRNECAQLSWYDKEPGRANPAKKHGRSITAPQRPMSAHTGGARPSPPRAKRPVSAKHTRNNPVPVIRHSSHKDYIMSSTYNHEPSHSFAVYPDKQPITARATRTSMMRMSLSRTGSGDWIIPETKSYLEQSLDERDNKNETRMVTKTKKNGGERKKRKKKKQEENKTDIFAVKSVKKWLKKNGLAAKKLTILDALAPTTIPHSSKYIPILDKHIVSKVFDDILPLAHTTGSSHSEVHIVNPQGVNLKKYEDKLEDTINLYQQFLNELVFVNLSDEERYKYQGATIPNFVDHKEPILKDLEEQGWPIKKKDIELLENEIEQAQVFLQQSKDLRKASEEASHQFAEQQKAAQEEAERKRLDEVMKKAPPKEGRTALPGNKNRLMNHRVLARNETDGFYYNGTVIRCPNSRYADVRFKDFDHEVQTVPVRYVISTGGARPCPPLKVGDYVLVRSTIPREHMDDVLDDNILCYVPGIVQVLPLRKSTATRCYTIWKFNGKKITATRSDVVKISKARYIFACRYIKDALLSTLRSTLYIPPPINQEDNRDKEENYSGDEDHNNNSKHSSRSNSPESQASSREGSRASSKSGSRASSRSGSRAGSRPGSQAGSRPGSQAGSRTGSHAGSKTGSHHSSKKSSTGSHASSKHSTPRDKHDSDANNSDDDNGSIFEGKDEADAGEKHEIEKLHTLRQTMEDEHNRQIEELEQHRARLEELQQQLQDQQDKQRQQQIQLQEQQRNIQEEQQKLISSQLENHRERQQHIQEEQRRLQQQQEELVRKQQEQQEQLLQQKYNQTQALQLQQQQLVQVKNVTRLADKETETDSYHPTPKASPRNSLKPSSSKTSPKSPRRSPRSSKGTSPRGSSKHSPASTPRDASPGESAKHSAVPTPGELTPHMSSRHSPASSPGGSRASTPRSQSPLLEDNGNVSDSGSSVHASEHDGEGVDEADAGGTPPEEPESQMQFHVSGGNEACLLTKGTTGLLISRLPPDEDPAIATQSVPRPIKPGEEVLARWSDDGWYYRGTIKQDCNDGSFMVEDGVGDLEQIFRDDIITDDDDADNVIKVGDPVVGLHPSFAYSYAPGVIVSQEEDMMMFSVRYYDGQESFVPREELYLHTADKFEEDCAFILSCEERVVGQAVVSRNEADGLFHLGSVRERVGNGRQYIVEWADQTLQLQSSAYIFGAHTKRHPLAIGDRVLALADAATFLYMPGWVSGSNGTRLVVKYCNGQTSNHVDPLQCFWLSKEYYDRIVSFWKSKNEKR